MDRRELKSQIEKIVQESTNVDLMRLTQDIDMFLGAAFELTAALGRRYRMLRADRFKNQKAPRTLRNSLSAPETQLDSSQPRNPSKARSQAVSQ